MSAVDASRAAQGRRRFGEGWMIAALLLPGLLALLATFLLPLLWLVRQSFAPQPTAPDTSAFTLENYRTILVDPFYWRMAGNSLLLGAIVAVVGVILSFPVALFLARTPSRWRGFLTALAIAPLLTSTIVRTYGWLVLLSPTGVVNVTLRSLHLIERPLPLANNFTGVVIALIEILMPYAILAMLSGFGRLNVQLEDAAALLGANRWRVFRRIILPLSLPGVLNALLLVFVLAISSFVTPRLMGGGRVFVFGTEVYDEATNTLNWPGAAALSMLLLVLFALVIALYQRAMRAVEQS